jgi:hypothetical protein
VQVEYQAQIPQALLAFPLVALPQEVALMERHLRLVPPLVQEALPLGQGVPRQVREVQAQAQVLVPVRARALAQQLALAERLALDLEQELSRGLEQGLQLPQELVQDLQLAKVEAQDLVAVLARVAVLGLILEQD